MQKDYNVVPGFYAAGLYVNCRVVEAGLKKPGGKSDDKEKLREGAALRSISTDTPRGPIKFDHFGNVIGDFYIRRVEKVNGKLVNKTVKTYHNVSQFWTYDEKKFLAQPVYSRNYPPLKSDVTRAAGAAPAPADFAHVPIVGTVRNVRDKRTAGTLRI